MRDIFSVGFFSEDRSVKASSLNKKNLLIWKPYGKTI